MDETKKMNDPVDALDNPAASPVKELDLFYLIDVSGSMDGSKIQAVNQAMNEAITLVAKISDDNKDNAIIKVNVMTFANTSEWMYGTSIYATDMTWQDVSAGGGTYFGETCLSLERAMHRKGSEARINPDVHHKVPAVILISDGQPLDSNWENDFAKLKANPFFDEASKIAIGIGNDCDWDMLRKFTGGENVYEAHNVQQIKDAIRIVSSVASKVSSSVNASSAPIKDQIKEGIQNTGDNGTVQTYNSSNSRPPDNFYD